MKDIFDILDEFETERWTKEKNNAMNALMDFVDFLEDVKQEAKIKEETSKKDEPVPEEAPQKEEPQEPPVVALDDEPAVQQIILMKDNTVDLSTLSFIVSCAHDMLESAIYFGRLSKSLRRDSAIFPSMDELLMHFCDEYFPVKVVQHPDLNKAFEQIGELPYYIVTKVITDEETDELVAIVLEPLIMKEVEKCDWFKETIKVD